MYVSVVCLRKRNNELIKILFGNVIVVFFLNNFYIEIY